MNYIEWSKEYFIDAEKIKQRLDVLKAERKYARVENIKNLNRRITMLYSMYLECKHTGRLLYNRAGGQTE